MVAILLTIGQFGFNFSSAFAAPLRLWSAVHDKQVHKDKAPFTILTNTEFHDDITPMVVRGEVISLTGGDDMPITGFEVRTTVMNNTPFDWLNYVFSFEYAQHQFLEGSPHWKSEGYSQTLGNQPIITPNNQTVYTFFDIPSVSIPDATEIPGRKRRGIVAGGTDSFNQRFTIGQESGEPAGAAVGSELFNFLTAANTFVGTQRPDIHWAREDSQGPSDYEEPLAADQIAGQPGQPNRQDRILISFDDPNNNLPNNNTGAPENDSNVSVYPKLSQTVLRQAIASGMLDPEPDQIQPIGLQSIGPRASFNPDTELLTLSGGIIDVLQLVDDPNNPIYVGDILNGAEIVVEDLQREFDIDGFTHFFTGGQLQIIKNGELLLQGDITDFAATDIEERNGFLMSFGILQNLSFPGLSQSPFLQDILSDLSSNQFLTLDFAINTLDGTTFASILNDALASQTSIDIPIDMKLTMNGVPISSVPESSSILSLLAVGTISVASALNRKLKSSKSSAKELE